MSKDPDFMDAFDEKPETAVVETPVVAPVVAPVETPVVAPVAGSAPAMPVEQKPVATPAPVMLTDDQFKKLIPVKEPEEEGFEFPEPPDPRTHPAEYREYERQVHETNLLNERLNMSEEMARDKHGDKIVDTVQTWFDAKAKTDPLFFQKVVSHRNPYKFAIAEYENEQLLTSLQNPDERKAFDEWKKQRANGGSPPVPPGGSTPAQSAQPGGSTPATTQPAVGQPAASQSPAIPTSIVDAPSAGRAGNMAIPIGNGQAFDSTFAN